MADRNEMKEVAALVEQLADSVSVIRVDESLEDYKARMHTTWVTLVDVLRRQQAEIERLDGLSDLGAASAASG